MLSFCSSFLNSNQPTGYRWVERYFSRRDQSKVLRREIFQGKREQSEGLRRELFLRERETSQRSCLESSFSGRETVVRGFSKGGTRKAESWNFPTCLRSPKLVL